MLNWLTKITNISLITRALITRLSRTDHSRYGKAERPAKPNIHLHSFPQSYFTFLSSSVDSRDSASSQFEYAIGAIHVIKQTKMRGKVERNNTINERGEKKEEYRAL